MTPREERHDACVTAVAYALRCRGYVPRRTDARADGHDIAIGDIRVRVIAAAPTVHVVRPIYGARAYRYEYPTLHWNLHRHGRLDDRWDVAVLVGDVDPIVLPRAEARCSAVRVHLGEHRRASRWDRFRGAWGVIG